MSYESVSGATLIFVETIIIVSNSQHERPTRDKSELP